jgi:hypothetical protein
MDHRSGLRIFGTGFAVVIEKKVILRCPVSRREVEWDKFCYFVEGLDNAERPKQL